MAILKQHDKRSGITYVYESIAAWDSKKGYSVAKRKLIGKIDKDTGKMVPTDGRNRKAMKAAQTKTEQYSRHFYGATYLLDQIGCQLGLIDNLKQCFPNNYLQILSIVYFLITEETSSLQRFEKWHRLHYHPYSSNIPSQRSSEILSSITETQRSNFFEIHARRSSENEYWCYDTTTISSYSQTLKQVKHGYNKEHDPFPQLNLALVYGEQSRLPLYYRKLAGNIPDVKTLTHLIHELDSLGFNSPKLVMDKGFYSKDNVEFLLSKNIEFIQAIKISLKFIQKEIESVYDSIKDVRNYSPENKLYAKTVKMPFKGSGNDGISLHIYFNIERAADEELSFNEKLNERYNEIVTNKRESSHEAFYKKYFIISNDTNETLTVEYNIEEITAHKRYFGYFALLSNTNLSAVEVIGLYRNKDVIEKSFGNLKEKLNFRRTLVSSEHSLNGKLFIEFIALIFLSHIKRKMEETGLFKDYTLQGLIDELDTIECFKGKNKRLHVNEILKKQEDIYRKLGVDIPTSL